ncbi:hypothetical protein [Ligilactobacillus aviarius]|uniref:hypothetical protein n=1 Tax=Ligilactobacillus aviarius TaxID=1606 RepID=UPI00249EF1E9|nr:hypothetical protein [Ligilactobacillus aviarius]
MNNNKLFNAVSWMKHNLTLSKTKVTGLIVLLSGFLCSMVVLPTTHQRPLSGLGNILEVSGVLILISVYAYLGVRISSTKKICDFKYWKSIVLTAILHWKMKEPEGNDASAKYDIEVYNRKIVPKTFAVVTNDEVICFYREASSFRLHNLDTQNQARILDYVSRKYAGHCSAWQPLKDDKKYKDYFVSVVKLN